MQITGEFTQTVNISVKPEETISALAKHFGINCYIRDDYGEYTAIETKNDTEYLRRYKDTSYHGSPKYDVIIETSNENDIKAYKCLKELEELIQAKERKEGSK